MSGRARIWKALLVAVAVALVVATRVVACDAPVYLFALENWERDPYQIYYFFRDAEDSADQEANRLLDQMASGEVGHANVEFARVRVSASDDLRVDIWKRHGEGELPVHVVLNPAGSRLFVGRLNVKEVRAMASSPKREEIADKLCRGAQGVVLLLTSGTADDSRAREICQQVVAEAREEGTAVEYLELSRADRAERWFVRQLLAVEDDLAGTNAPIAYGVFGRGHVLEPFVGAGITRDSVRQLIAYMNGPCTCELKAANPGMDLLTSVNWSKRIAGLPAARERPAESFLMGAADGGGYVEFDVQTSDQPEAEGQPGETAAQDSGTAAGPTAPDAQIQPVRSCPSAAAAAGEKGTSAEGATVKPQEATDTGPAQAPVRANPLQSPSPRASSDASGQIRKPSTAASETTTPAGATPGNTPSTSKPAAANVLDKTAAPTSDDKNAPAAAQQASGQAAPPTSRHSSVAPTQPLADRPDAIGIELASPSAAAPEPQAISEQRSSVPLVALIGLTLAAVAVLALGAGTIILLKRPRE